MAKTSKYGSKMKGGKTTKYSSKMKGGKNTKYSSKMKGGKTAAQRGSKMSSKMTPTFNELVKKKTGGRV
jgi:hypothetical protein|tara:strand:- start:715 stop:921 length:207 start_codon:yes stop_codon:yes gene_type:complete